MANRSSPKLVPVKCAIGSDRAFTRALVETLRPQILRRAEEITLANGVHDFSRMQGRVCLWPHDPFNVLKPDLTLRR